MIFFPEIREVGCSLPLLPRSRGGFVWIFRVDAVRPRPATDREISTRRAQTWQKMFQILRFAHTWCRATACARRETTPTCIGSFKAFRCLRCAAPCVFRASTAQIARSLHKVFDFGVLDTQHLGFFPRNQGGGVLAPSSTGLVGQIWRDFPKQSLAPPHRDGSRDLDEKSASVAKDVPKSSFRSHLVSRHHAREARNHAELYRTL